MRLSVPTSARAPMLGAGVFLAFGAVLYAAVLAWTGGVFSFTLDDPYIHLAMAEEIGRGGYGVNPGEPASASSSIVYPFVLAGLMAVGLGQFSALWLNLAAGAVAAGLLIALAQVGGLVTSRIPPWVVGVLAGLLMLILNLGGLAFTGMEHTLQLALALAALLGVQRLGRDGVAPVWLAPVLAAAPLVRFEGAAVLAAGALALVSRRRWAEAALAVVIAAAAAVLFVGRLHQLGLPLLPSSVLAKAADGAHGFGSQFLENQRVRESALVIAAIAFPFASEVLARGRRPLRLPVQFTAAVLLAQLTVGTFGWRYNGWLHRYEAWAMALAVGVALLCYGERLRLWLADAPRVRTSMAVVTVLALFQPYVLTTWDTPLDARSIRLQQREMHRFAADVLRAPVAVNDLGWVSFRNDHPVLDLWGLASEPARRARQAHLPPEWMDDLARRRGVRAVMIYDGWFAAVPRRWVRLGDLRARVPLSVSPRVAFYAVDAQGAPSVRAAIAVWARGLPPQDVFVPVADVTTPAGS